ncbi:hemicentin-2-like [Penaeus indicus]|uniref:hemicentin-2-like n=1 Tax=Penaeus indicus TaxID=29960 RepID=UPI00300D4733
MDYTKDRKDIRNLFAYWTFVLVRSNAISAIEAKISIRPLCASSSIHISESKSIEKTFIWLISTSSINSWSLMCLCLSFWIYAFIAMHAGDETRDLMLKIERPLRTCYQMLGSCYKDYAQKPKHMISAIDPCVSKAYTDYFGQYDYYSNYYDKDGEPPTFLARSQTFTVEIGQSVIIPCDVENTGSNKLIIKKLPARGGSEKLLAVGGAKVTTDRRILVDGSRLTITHALPRDAGTFLCHFDLEPPLQLRHTLDVQSAPSVKSLSPPEQVIKKGEEVVLQCKAHGNPTPIIRWSRQEGFMPSGKTTEQGQNVTLKDVDRHVDGTYLCTAGQRHRRTCFSSDGRHGGDVVRSTEGEMVELLCLVHGRPVPTVGWTHDGAALPDTHMDSEVDTPQDYAHDIYDAHTTQSHVSHRHTLTIQNITDVDFGSYMCIAENSHGVTNATIQLTGLPMSPMFTSSPNGEESHRYTLTWGTESLSPITEFVIKVRKSLTSPWQRLPDVHQARCSPE